MSTLKTNNIQHVDRSDPSIIINTDGSVNIAGTMTYEDVTNVDAVGIITGRSNIDAQKQVLVGTGVSVKAGGINVTAGITTVQALQATTISGTTATLTGNADVEGGLIVGNGVASPLSGFAAHFHSTGASNRIQITTSNTGVTNADGAIIMVDSGSNMEILNRENTNIEFFTNNSQRMFIDNGGKLVVGTNVSRSVGDVTAQMQLEGTSFSTSSLSLMSNAGASAGNTPHLTLGKSRGSSNGSSTIVANGDTLGQIQFAGADGTDCNSVAASIKAFIDGAPGSNDMPGVITFNTTADGAASPTERVRIDSSGDIGIDINDPVARLQINSTRNAETDRFDATNYHLALRNPEDDTGEAIGLSFGITSNTTKVGAAILHERDGGGSQGSLQFYTSSDGNSITERVRITSTGTVESYSTDDTTPNIKWRSDDVNWFGSLNQSVEGSTISTFLAVAGDWSANGSTYSATKNYNGSFETRAIALHPQFNGGSGKVSFLQKAGGSSTTDGAVTEILKIDNDGIKFGTDTATANALDDYEEGQWTPTVKFGSTAATVTVNGKYTKIGNLVHITYQISVNNLNGGTGNISVESLPFTVSQSPTYSHGICQGNSAKNLPSTAGSTMLFIESGSSRFRILYDTPTAHGDVNETMFDVGTTFYGNGTYFTSS